MSRISTLLSQAEIETKNIIRIMKPLIPTGYTLTYNLYPSGTIYLILSEDLTNKTVSDANVTYIVSDGISNKYAYINNVSSTIGNKTGTFLLYLHIYILIKLNITMVSLNNSTNIPDRAAKGIYKMFRVDMRDQNRSKYSGASLHDRLIISGGDMRLHVTDMNTWMDYFNDLVYSFNTKHTFKWNISKIEDIYTNLKQNYPYTSIRRINPFKKKVSNTSINTIRSKTEKKSKTKRQNLIREKRIKTKKNSTKNSTKNSSKNINTKSSSFKKY
jgi:hypothetical protein